MPSQSHRNKKDVSHPHEPAEAHCTEFRDVSDSIQVKMRAIEKKYQDRRRKLGLEPHFSLIAIDDPRFEELEKARRDYEKEYEQILLMLPKRPETPPGWEGLPPDYHLNTPNDLARYVQDELQRLHFFGRSRMIGKAQVSWAAETVLNAHRWLLDAGYNRPFPVRPTSADDAERELAALLHWLKKARRPSRSPRSRTGSRVKTESAGISLFDLAFSVEQDDKAAKRTVRDWINSKRVKAKPIGKCPYDARKHLYGLSELLSDVRKILALQPRELNKYKQALKAKLRAPKSG
jgi:hypothetical protein